MLYMVKSGCSPAVGVSSSVRRPFPSFNRRPRLFMNIRAQSCESLTPTTAEYGWEVVTDVT